MTPPQLALCLRDSDRIEESARVMSAASSGLELLVGTDLWQTLQHSSPAALRLVVADESSLIEASQVVAESYRRLAEAFRSPRSTTR